MRNINVFRFNETVISGYAWQTIVYLRFVWRSKRKPLLECDWYTLHCLNSNDKHMPLIYRTISYLSNHYQIIHSITQRYVRWLSLTNKFIRRLLTVYDTLCDRIYLCIFIVTSINKNTAVWFTSSQWMNLSQWYRCIYQRDTTFKNKFAWISLYLYFWND